VPRHVHDHIEIATDVKVASLDDLSDAARIRLGLAPPRSESSAGLSATSGVVNAADPTELLGAFTVFSFSAGLADAVAGQFAGVFAGFLGIGWWLRFYRRHIRH
jgi:hypothetical protein